MGFDTYRSLEVMSIADYSVYITAPPLAPREIGGPSSSRFRIQLPADYDFSQPGIYECALIEAYISEPPLSLYINIYKPETDKWLTRSFPSTLDLTQKLSEFLLENHFLVSENDGGSFEIKAGFHTYFSADLKRYFGLAADSVQEKEFPLILSPAPHPTLPRFRTAVIECENLVGLSTFNDTLRPVLGIYPLGLKKGLYTASSADYKKIGIGRTNFLGFRIRDEKGFPVIFTDREIYLHLRFRRTDA